MKPDDAGPRPLGELLKGSFLLARDGLKENAAIIAAGMLPGYALALAVMFYTGIDGKEALAAAFSAGRVFDISLVASAGLADKAFNAFGFVALVSALVARDDGGSIGPAEAYRRASERLAPFVWTELLGAFYVLLGCLLFLVPGILRAIRYSLAHMAVLIEGRSGDDALSRSKEIVLAHMGKVLGYLLAAAAAVLAAIVAQRLIVSNALAFLDRFPPAGGVLSAFAGELADGVVAAWGLAFTALLYRDLARLHPAPVQAP